jgi:dolichyldiphosphatase
MAQDTLLRRRKANNAPSQEEPTATTQDLDRRTTLPPHHTLTSLSLSHVQFVPDSILTELLAYVTLSPLAIFCGYVAVAVNGRDLKPLVMLAGQVLSEALNAIMKRVIKQARPTGMMTKYSCHDRAIELIRLHDEPNQQDFSSIGPNHSVYRRWVRDAVESFTVHDLLCNLLYAAPVPKVCYTEPSSCIAQSTRINFTDMNDAVLLGTWLWTTSFLQLSLRSSSFGLLWLSTRGIAPLDCLLLP